MMGFGDVLGDVWVMCLFLYEGIGYIYRQPSTEAPREGGKLVDAGGSGGSLMLVAGDYQAVDGFHLKVCPVDVVLSV